MTGNDAETLAAWVSAYVAETSRDENVERFVAHVNAAILAELPELADDPVVVAELHASTKAQFQVFLSLLERQEQELLLPPQAVDLALLIARRRLELSVLLKIYRVGAGAVWDFFTQVAASVPADGPDRTEVLIYLWDHGGTWINDAVERLIGVFYEEREATLHGALARRSETVHALLRGDPVPLDTASADLGHPLRGPQTAVVLWADEGGSADSLVMLNDLAAGVARAVGARALTVPAGHREVWVWLSSSRPVTAGELLAALDARKDGAGARAAMGITADGREGFRQSHREAVDAQRWAVATGSSARLTAYADVELACLMGGDGPRVRGLITRELGALAKDDPGLERVRETLTAFLSLGGNVDRTASQLTVHKNTVRYRLAQAEDLIGHPLTERRTEIAVALHCLQRTGTLSPD